MKYYLILILIITTISCHRNSSIHSKKGQSISLNVATDSIICDLFQFIGPRNNKRIEGSSQFNFPNSNFYTVNALLNGLASIRERKDLEYIFLNGDIGQYERIIELRYLHKEAHNYEIIHQIRVKQNDKTYHFVKFKDFEMGAHLLGIRGVIMIYQDNRYYLLSSTPKGLEEVFEWSIKVKSDLAASFFKPPILKIHPGPKYHIPEKYKEIVAQCKNYDEGINLKKFNKIANHSENKSQYYDEVYLYHY